MSIGVPIKLLHEVENHVVSIELKTGELFRGYLMDVEDTMNVRMDDVFVLTKEGKQYHLEQVYLRGSQIRFIVIPSFFKNAPMIKKVKTQTKKSKDGVIAKGKIRTKPRGKVVNVLNV